MIHQSKRREFQWRVILLVIALSSVFGCAASTQSYTPPVLTTTAIIEVYENTECKGIVLIERGKTPFGKALPGGKVEYGESVEQAIRREILEEVHLDLQDLQQFYVYSDPSRDPRHHSVEVTHVAKAYGAPVAGDDAARAFLVQLEEIPWDELAFDHAAILQDYMCWKNDPSVSLGKKLYEKKTGDAHHACSPQDFKMSWNAQSVIEGVKGINKDIPSQLVQLLDELLSSGMVMREGTDAELRPLFVGLQACFEQALTHWLHSKSLKQALCIIHAPAPATPLCTQGVISASLVHPAVLHDPQRLQTVQTRPDILRAYLAAGGSVVSTYTKQGYASRSAKELAIFEGLLQQYPNLHAVELRCDIPQDVIGATYLCTFADGQTYVFSIRSSQALTPMDGKWSVWFGSLEQPVVAQRYAEISSFLREQKPDLFTHFLSGVVQ